MNLIAAYVIWWEFRYSTFGTRSNQNVRLLGLRRAWDQGSVEPVTMDWVLFCWKEVTVSESPCAGNRIETITIPASRQSRDSTVVALGNAVHFRDFESANMAQ
jgi:hypothetical protein